MIFSKNASFPYPVYANGINSYIEPAFSFDVQINDNYDNYVFKGSYEINSPYISNLIETGAAELFYVIQSKDNQYYRVMNNEFDVEVKKSRISLSKRTAIQMMVMANTELNYSDNDELDPYYDKQKNEIIIPKNSMIAMSNVIYFDGDIKHPYKLFEKKLDKNLSSAMKYELSDETIIIHYRDEKYMSIQEVLNHPYIYTGLYKALMSMIRSEAEVDEDFIDLLNIDRPSGLNSKLYDLMINKGIPELTYENIDEVIDRITDRIIDKYALALKRLETYGD